MFRNRHNKINNQTKLEEQLPVDIMISIFQLLQLKDLAKVPLLSTKWKNIFDKPYFWSTVTIYNNLHDYLGLSLFHAVANKKNIKLVQHYCRLGADVNMLVNTWKWKDCGWLRRFDTKSYYNCATTLSIAANSTYGKNGELLVRTLLEYGANPTLKSTYIVYMVSSHFGFLSPWPPREETPSESARDKNIKAILLLAEHEFAVRNNMSESEIISSLKKAIDIRCTR